MRCSIRFKAALVGGSICGALCALPAVGLAQVSSINSAVIVPRVFNDIPSASGSYINAYPSSIILKESNVNSATGFADRDNWYFSADGGTTPYHFQSGDYFHSSFTVDVTGGAAGKDIEAGYIFSDPSGSFGGDTQIIVTGGGVVFQGGGPSYYPFSPAAGGFPGAGGSVPNYVEGTAYTMGFNYVLDPNTNLPAFQYSVNGQFAANGSGTYFDLGGPVGNPGPDTLGGYFQIQTDSLSNPPNNGQAIFSNISITPARRAGTGEPELVSIGRLGAIEAAPNG